MIKHVIKHVCIIDQRLSVELLTKKHKIMKTKLYVIQVIVLSLLAILFACRNDDLVDLPVLDKTEDTVEDQIEEQPYYCYTPEGKVTFEVSDQKVLVKFSEGTTFSMQQTLLGEERDFMPIPEEMFLDYDGLAVMDFATSVQATEVDNILKRMRAKEGIDFINPFLISTDGSLQAAGDALVVGLKNRSDLSVLEAEAAARQAVILREDEYTPLMFHLKTTGGKALEVSNGLAETGIFKYAEPNMVRYIPKISTNDPLLNQQWALNNSGQSGGTPGADMNVLQAWQLNNGSPSITIAILDEGVDLTHPDLIDNLVPGFDATGGGSNGGPNPSDAHGTACAGIAAAIGNNGRGIAGVAFRSRILPIRIGIGSGVGNQWITYDTWLANGINWAWQHGADILSNSWSAGTPSTIVNSAIDNAVAKGRNGLGSLVLFSSGNQNSGVAYPARYDKCIAVGATSPCDERKSPTSCDGENWGSNYGTDLDIAAPGVIISTTDIQGIAGYSSGDYISNFNGTSAACPNAAGVAALILAINPQLTQAEARSILESTSDKVGNYHYSGGKSQELGYGRVNAHKAVLQASAGAPIKYIVVNNLKWMTENLNIDVPGSIPHPIDNNRYGRLYTLHGAMNGCKAAGGRLATDSEWQGLARAVAPPDGGPYDWLNQTSLGNSISAFKALILGGSSGFNALKGGMRKADGSYYRIGREGYYWTSTPYLNNKAIAYLFPEARLYRTAGEVDGWLSCRCVLD
jgi:uncharacterized protein (TIGR02145 family)